MRILKIEGTGTDGDRNPNILPSITQLSNSALKAVGSTMTQQRIPATGQ